MPLPAPVMTATRPCQALHRSCYVAHSSVAMKTFLVSVKAVRRVRAELAAEAGLLEAAERRPVAHRGVRVDRQVAGLDRRGPPAAPGRRRGSRSSRTGRTSVSLASRIASASSSNGQHRRRPGRRSPRASARSAGSTGGQHGRREPEARARRARCRGRRPARRRARRSATRVALRGARSAGPSRSSRRPGRRPRTACDRGLEQLQEPVVAPSAGPGSGSGRSSPARRCRRPPYGAVAAACSRSASAKTMLALLPPSSRVTRFTCAGAAAP